MLQERCTMASVVLSAQQAQAESHSESKHGQIKGKEAKSAAVPQTWASWRDYVNEPYRILFPIALINIFLGCILWLPLLFDSQASAPLRGHMDMFVHATLGVFAVGFLLTFLPKRLQSEAPPMVLTMLVTGMAVIMPISIYLQAPAVLALVALLMNLCVLVWAAMLGPVWLRAPAPLILVPLGVAIQSMGLAVDCIRMQGVEFSFLVTVLAENWQRQAGLLLMVFGIAAVLLPQLSCGRCCGGEAPSKVQLFKPFAIATILAGSYGFTVLGSLGDQFGAGLRCILALVIFAHALPLFKPQRTWPKFMHGIWISCWSIIIGLGLRAVWPGHALSWDHFIYITGFVQLTLFIAARVLTAHAGAGHILQKDRVIPIVIGVLMMLSVLARVGVDWSPQTPALHLGLAGACALLALCVWTIRYAGQFCRRAVE